MLVRFSNPVREFGFCPSATTGFKYGASTNVSVYTLYGNARICNQGGIPAPTPETREIDLNITPLEPKDLACN